MSYPKRGPVAGSTTASARGPKNEKLRGLLIGKFKTKFSQFASEPQFEEIIASEVDQMLFGGSQATESNLVKLDKKLSQMFGVLSSAPKSKASSRSSHSPSVQVGKQRDGSAQSKRSTVSKVSQASKQSGKSSQQDMTEEIWNDIARYNATKFEEDQKIAQQKEIEKKAKINQDLQKQVQEKRKLQAAEVKQEEEYAKQQQEFLKEQQRADTRKKMELQRKLQQETQVRDRQLQETRQRKEEEKKQERQMAAEKKQQLIKEQKDQEIKEKAKIENYKEACQKQYVENMKLLEIAKNQEMNEESKRQAKGDDLLGQLFNEKKHISYQKRERNDKQLELLKPKLAAGNTQKRLEQEEQAIANYVKKKEQEDEMDELNRKKKNHKKEQETKRWLDLQMEERQGVKKVEKFGNDIEATYILKDVAQYQEQEKSKREMMERLEKKNNENLKSQIHERTLPVKLDAAAYKLNKPFIEEVKANRNK